MSSGHSPPVEVTLTLAARDPGHRELELGSDGVSGDLMSLIDKRYEIRRRMGALKNPSSVKACSDLN